MCGGRNQGYEHLSAVRRAAFGAYAGRRSSEQLEELCRANEDVQIERMKDGIIRMNPPACGLTGDGNAEIGWQLRSWWKRHRNGRTFDSNTGFYLPDGSQTPRMRCPLHWLALRLMDTALRFTTGSGG